ncbi:hypothetical protein CB1_000210004 [Camelus ferus]|nr:hypothetical protein CB1_000210004 [Camelus ferus]
MGGPVTASAHTGPQGLQACPATAGTAILSALFTVCYVRKKQNFLLQKRLDPVIKYFRSPTVCQADKKWIIAEDSDILPTPLLLATSPILILWKLGVSVFSVWKLGIETTIKQ